MMHHLPQPWKPYEIPAQDEQGMNGKTERCAKRVYVQVQLVNTEV